MLPVFLLERSKSTRVKKELHYSTWFICVLVSSVLWQPDSVSATPRVPCVYFSFTFFAYACNSATQIFFLEEKNPSRARCKSHALELYLRALTDEGWPLLNGQLRNPRTVNITCPDSEGL